MKCKICANQTEQVFVAKVMGKYDVGYYFCKNCDFLQTEKPYWLNEAYSDSINISDTGIMQRNTIFAQYTASVVTLFFDRNAKFLDFAGGYGMLTRLMRDIGIDYYWHDKFSKNLIARGFEYNSNENYELVTSLESFEHFDNPLFEIEKLLSISNNILFSTEVFRATPPEKNWWYYGFNHGQHISFYSIRTLEFIAIKYNLNLYTNGKT